MPEEQVRAGQDWVKQTLKRLADESHVQIEISDWGVGGDDFDRGEHSLEFYVGGERHVEKFSREKLSFCPGDRAVRAELESRIRGIVKSFCAPEKKIGF